jgi:hypothetical protein
MFRLPTVKKIDVTIIGEQKTHPTVGYRLWQGIAESSEDIVALALIENEQRYSWVRCSTRQHFLKMKILFSPIGYEGKSCSVSFSVGDSVVCGEPCVMHSHQTEPNPLPNIYQTGEIIRFAQLLSTKPTILHVLFLAKTDVQMLRNRIWHLKPKHLEGLDAPWRKVLTFGRTGIVEKSLSGAQRY